MGKRQTGLKKAPQEMRRRNSARITTVPAGGREGPVPKWPLGKATKEEQARWEELWVLPQAVIWEAMGIELEVATFVRVALKAEATLDPRLLTERRLLGDRLLLSPVSMFRSQVQIVDEAGELTEGNISSLEAYRRAVGDG